MTEKKTCLVVEKKNKNNKNKNNPTYRPMKNVPCFRKQDVFFLWPDVCTSYFGSMNQYDLMFDLKINVGHRDLYSMVQ